MCLLIEGIVKHGLNWPFGKGKEKNKGKKGQQKAQQIACGDDN
jgi:hypothetical protein